MSRFLIMTWDGAGNLAPQLKLDNEKEKPVTINYDELVKSWQK